ncbi:MAG: C4-type zinc ribbon domain-containing protein [Candidatus Gygaella obscura]|nr:C4-type zinc ribbon domain-containing protein [Candidatus Gygaella obscura]
MPISIKEQLKKLIVLQDFDSKIYKLKEEKGRMPELIERLNSEFEQKKDNFKRIENLIIDNLKRRKEKEIELGIKEEKVKKQHSQLYTLKKNEEYKAMLKEIEGIKADSSVLEDDIIELMDELDLLNKDKEKEAVVLKQEEDKLKEVKVKIDLRTKEIDSTLKDLEFKRSQIAQETDRGVLAGYEKILENKDGLAIVAVYNNSCQGCFMNVTAQIINEIKMFDKIIHCGMCSRILYLEDDMVT